MSETLTRRRVMAGAAATLPTIGGCSTRGDRRDVKMYEYTLSHDVKAFEWAVIRQHANEDTLIPDVQFRIAIRDGVNPFPSEAVIESPDGKRMTYRTEFGQIRPPEPHPLSLSTKSFEKAPAGVYNLHVYDSDDERLATWKLEVGNTENCINERGAPRICSDGYPDSGQGGESDG